MPLNEEEAGVRLYTTINVLPRSSALFSFSQPFITLLHRPPLPSLTALHYSPSQPFITLPHSPPLLSLAALHYSPSQPFITLPRSPPLPSLTALHYLSLVRNVLKRKANVKLNWCSYWLNCFNAL